LKRKGLGVGLKARGLRVRLRARGSDSGGVGERAG